MTGAFSTEAAATAQSTTAAATTEKKQVKQRVSIPLYSSSFFSSLIESEKECSYCSVSSI